MKKSNNVLNIEDITGKNSNNNTNINNNFDSKKFDNRFFDDSGQYENLDRFIVNFQDYIKEEEGGL